MRPAVTAATSPEALSPSAGRYARNGTVNEIAVLTVGSETRDRTIRLRTPTTPPTATAATTAHAKLSATPPKDTVEAIAATAARNSTSALASLSMLSPSSTAVTRAGAPIRLAIEVATASVGLTMAPSAMPVASPIPGITQWKKNPKATALISTSTTDNALIVQKSRRKSIVGIDTAAAYSSGGRTPTRIHSGSISTAGTNSGIPTSAPITTRTSAGATWIRGARSCTAAMSSTATTTRRICNMEAIFPHTAG